MSVLVYGPIFALGYYAEPQLLWTNVFVKMLASARFILLLAGATIFQVWLRDLEVVNEDSITFEEMVVRRLNALERMER